MGPAHDELERIQSHHERHTALGDVRLLQHILKHTTNQGIQKLLRGENGPCVLKLDALGYYVDCLSARYETDQSSLASAIQRSQ